MSDRHLDRDLQLLTAIEEGAPLTQRALAERLGVALGLANLCLKRLARKGYIKVVHFNDRPAARKRLRYLLTPKGLAEKSRLTYEHMVYSLHLYRRTRQTLRESLGRMADRRPQAGGASTAPARPPSSPISRCASWGWSRWAVFARRARRRRFWAFRCDRSPS